MMLDLARHPRNTTDRSKLVDEPYQQEQLNAQQAAALVSSTPNALSRSTSQQDGVRGILSDIDASWPDR